MPIVENHLNDPLSDALSTHHSKPLKICLLGYRSNPFSGGQGIYIRYLSQALAKRGHDVDVISGPPYPDLVSGIRLIKLPSLDLYSEENHITALKAKHLLSFTDFYEWFSMLTGAFAEPYTFGRRLARYFRQNQPDYDIIHDNQSLCYGLLDVLNQGYSLVSTIHHPITSDLQIALDNTEDWGMRLLIRRWHSFLNMQKKVVKQLPNIVSVSHCSANDISEAFQLETEQISVIHNGIDTETFKPMPEVQRQPCTIMATASADAPLKGLDYLIRAVHDLIPHYPEIKLLVVGKLKPEGDSARLISQLEMNQRITFVSGITTEALVKFYAEATLVVVPSIYEGFGLPAGEAMACGVPVVSTDGGALPEVVGEAGVVVPVRNSGAIAEAIADLLEDPRKRQEMSVQARERIVNQFSWDVAAATLEEYYSNMLAENNLSQQQLANATAEAS